MKFGASYAAPVYQLQQYYIYGKVDDCASKWTDLLDCLKRKTTKYKEEVGKGSVRLICAASAGIRGERA